MRYTIETIIKVDGGAYPFLTKCEGDPKDKDFTAYLEKHTASIERYLNPRHPLEEVFAGVPGAMVRATSGTPSTPSIEELLKGIEALGARPKKAKHPLEEVFAGVPGAIPNAGDRVHLPPVVISRAFRDCGRYADMRTPLVWGLPPLHWVKASVIWAAVRLVKQGGQQTIADVLAAAVLQATKGKGQRHGGDTTPFLEQPWAKLYRTHGLGFLLGQADKKYHEALSKADAESFEREILGAIVYLGMALLALEGRV